MNISELQLQRSILGKAFAKSYNELFAAHLAQVQDESKDIAAKVKASDEFYQAQKSLRNEYETEKYKLDIKESPSIHTMTSAMNYKQKLLMEDMNNRIEAEGKKLKEKISSGEYSFLEQIELKKEFKNFQAEIRDRVSKEISEFRSSYSKALVNRDYSKVDSLENSLLSNLLAKS